MRKTLLALFFCLGLACTGYSDVIYNFSGTFVEHGPEITWGVTFTLTTPDFVVDDSNFWPGAQMVCSGCTDIHFVIDAHAHGYTTADNTSVILIEYPFAIPGMPAFYFDLGDFAADGIYHSILVPDNVATLEVSSTVAEPTSILLLGVGLAGIGGAALRKRK